MDKNDVLFELAAASTYSWCCSVIFRLLSALRDITVLYLISNTETRTGFKAIKGKQYKMCTFFLSRLGNSGVSYVAVKPVFQFYIGSTCWGPLKEPAGTFLSFIICKYALQSHKPHVNV